MNVKRSSKLICFILICIILTFLMGFSSGTICEKCDFPHLKKERQRCKASATEREKSTHQVTLGVTLNYVIPHEDNQQPKGNNIVVSLNNEIRYIDNRSYNPHEEENEHSCQCYCGRVFNPSYPVTGFLPGVP